MLLLDNSAWARLSHPRLGDERAEEVAQLLEAGEVAVCLPFLLEAGYSARSAADHEQLIADLSELARVEITADVTRLALDAQSQLARVGHHRVPPSDLVIAACAHVGADGVLHYDRDYDVIAERTTLAFASEWLAPAGSL